MTSMNADLVRRIARLPEPRNAGDAMQPLFEAIMNSIQSTQDKFGKKVAANGTVEITLKKAGKKTPFKGTVQDNGVGLDDRNFTAFITTDTGHKIKRGGKGVGRLLWLACFEKIEITSDFVEDGGKKRRNFTFKLANKDQVQNQKISELGKRDKRSGFVVKFTGLKARYSGKFPHPPKYLFQHLLSHFLPVIVGKSCPEITITYGSESRTFPRDISQYIYRRKRVKLKYGTKPLSMEMLECNKTVSSNLVGNNFIHFIAHDRTVHSQPIDSKLGLKVFGGDRVFHACLSGIFLDSHVSQERTQFTFESNTIEDIVSTACMPKIQQFLSKPLEAVKDQQIKALTRIIEYYPSVAFGTPEVLSERMPPGQTEDEQLYSVLSIDRHRRDKNQRKKITAALQKLRGKADGANGFDDTVQEASKAISDTEQRSLAEYVVRRKIVINFLRELLKAGRARPKDSDYNLESTLHNFICPIRVGSEGVEASSHDLWIIDERLTFAQTFSSDMPFDKVLTESENSDRPDLLVFDHAFGLRHSQGDPRVLIVEFKRPGRKSYSGEENPQFQVER